MPSLKSEHYEALVRRLGYRFSDPQTLQLALSHRSVSATRNNERLEFLGDSILNFIVGHFLFEQYPKEKEGQLSRLRASLVKEPTLASVARDLSLGDYLLLGPGELKSGGYRRDSILADALEAILAAVYLDSGKDIEVCRERIHVWFGERLKDIAPAESLKDSKTRLQELLQSRRLALPVYTVTAVEGDAHNQRFFVECQVPVLGELTQGAGNSRREAEQEAAAAALRLLESVGK